MAQGDVTTKNLDGNVYMIKKANKADTQMVVTTDPLLQEDEFQSLYFTPKKNTNVVVEPPFNPLQLASLVHRNNVLAQCITAMEVNIDSSGYTFDLLEAEEDKSTGDDINDTANKLNRGRAVDDSPSGLQSGQNAKDSAVGVPTQKVFKAFGQPQPPQQPSPQQPPQPPMNVAGKAPTPDSNAKDGKDSTVPNGKKVVQQALSNNAVAGVYNPDTEIEEVDPELEMLEHFFNEPFPGMSFTTIRRKLRIDMESTGNGYLEVIRNMAGEVVFVRHLESVMMRLVKLDAPTNVEVTVTRGGKEVKATLPMRERRFAYKVGAHLVFYREFGSSRQVNKKTGAWIEVGSDDNKKPDLLGSEVLHFAVYKDFRTHYGMPRWINQLPSILGSRKSEEFNLEFFDAGGLPPAIIFVQGGALVGGVKEQLQQYLSGKASSKHRAAIVEVMSTSGSLDSAGSVTVKTERFGATAQDAMFQQYDANCGEHVRKSFRLPKILIGDTDVMNRATAEAAIQAAENQVFQPERFHFDEVINTTIIKALGAKRYKMRSLNMTISDPEMQLNALKASWNLIDGETYVDTANEISGLDMKYSAAAEQANKPQAPAGGGPMGGDGGGDPNDPNGDGSGAGADTGSTPGQYDDGSQGSMQPPAPNQNIGTPRVPVGMQGDPNAGAELGQAPSSGAAFKVEKTERLSPTDIVRLVNNWSIAMGLASGSLTEDEATILYEVANLQKEDRTFFDQLVVKKMFKAADPDAIALIGSCDHDHS